MEKELQLSEFIENFGDRLELNHLNPAVSLEGAISTVELNRPGLELVGYWDFFEPERVQIFGNKEMAFLTTMSDEELKTIISRFFHLQVPCAIFANNLEPSDLMFELASEYQVPMFQSALQATELVATLNEILTRHLAPSTTKHGSMIDVYGIGVLFIGRSGIGKSEVSLDLVERGHRLVADDVVRIRREGSNVLIGTGHELLEHHLEVRGIGILDVRRMFGIRAIRAQKRLEVVVELVEWDSHESYERLGINDQSVQILGVDIPYIKLPIFPGKNITVLVEVIALNQLLKIYGEYPAKEFQAQLLERLREQSDLNNYLRKDYE